MLLPDAPPRKRQTKRKSLERQPCVMAGHSVSASAPLHVEPNSSAQPEVAQASTPPVHVVVDYGPDCTQPAAASTSSGAAPSFDTAQAAAPSSPEYYPVLAVIDYIDEAEPGTPEADTVPNSPQSSIDRYPKCEF